MTSQDDSKSSVPYTLFLYREELRRRNARYLRLSHTKIALTDELISQTIPNLHECSTDELRVISREMRFKSELKSRVFRMHKLHQLGFKNISPDIESTDL